MSILVNLPMAIHLLVTRKHLSIVVPSSMIMEVVMVLMVVVVNRRGIILGWCRSQVTVAVTVAYCTGVSGLPLRIQGREEHVIISSVQVYSWFTSRTH